MHSNKFLSSLLVLLLILSCNPKGSQESQPDDIYQFRDYISYSTYGQQSIASEVTVVLAKPLEQYEAGQEIPSNYLEFVPKVAGSLVAKDANTLVFRPQEPLKPDTEYSATLHLNKLYGSVPKEFRTYTFTFKTLAPNFKIEVGNLQSYSKTWQYLGGTLEAADILPEDKVKDLVKAEFDGKPLNIVWEDVEQNTRYFSFKIDSIPRKKTDEKIKISWDGSPIGVNNKGEEWFSIPAQDKFVVLDAKATAAPNPRLTLNFSEPLDENQDLRGLVTIEKATNLRFSINGNVLEVYPDNNLSGNVRVQAFSGLKSSTGEKLSHEFSELISFEQLKPEVRLISKGTILPNAKNTPIYFETVNLSAVDVWVIQVFENNMLQHLQQYNLGESYLYDLRRVGRPVAHKVLDLKNESGNGQWKAHALDLSKLIKPHHGSLYRVEFSFRKEYSMYQCQATEEDTTEFSEDRMTDTSDEEAQEERFWDNMDYNRRNDYYDWSQRDNPCSRAYYNEDRMVYTHLLASDLGLIVKKGKNLSYHIVATNLLTAQPEPNTKVTLYNYQQQPLAELVTDENGVAIHDGTKNASFVVAQKGNNYAYAKLEDGNMLNISKFDVSGMELQKGLQGFIYTERGVYRPGDPIHLTFVLDDRNNPLPKNHPVVLEVTDPRGKLVQRTVLGGEHPSETAISARQRNGFYYFPIPTEADAPTGNWNATILVGGAQFQKTLKVATVKPNRLKIALHFDDEILKANEGISGNAQVNWLHGAPARNLKLDIDAKIVNAGNAFKGYPGYVFTDPVRSFRDLEMPFYSGTLSESGNLSFNKKLPIGPKAPGMLQAIFTTKAFEGGGDFSMDVQTMPIAPFTHFVGLKSPDPKEYGSFYTDEKNTFDVVSLTAAGKPAGNRELKVTLFKIEWRWWWNRGNDNLSRYENTQVHRPMKEFTIKTDAQGKGSFPIEVPDNQGGRYLLRVEDVASGHATGRTAYFYKNWWQRPNDGDSESAKILLFTTDKDRYKTGEHAIITFPSSKGGRALVSIENGTEVLSTQWVDTQEKETKVTLPITPEMAPNVFVNISLLQPHGTVLNDLPIRLYGIVPILVDNPATILDPKLQMADVLQPEKDFTVKVSESHKKPMTYSLAVVDEGLLDLTRYTTPDIHSAFYSRQALGVKTFDIYDDVMGAYSVNVGNIYAIGGGDAAAGAKNRKAQRFKPVVTYLGPFELKAGETATHEIHMPNYVGSVKTMVVAGNLDGAYGKAEKATPVRKPLMVLASVPRKLSPGEKVTIPVTVFAMEDKVKNVKLSIKAGKAFKPLGATSQELHFTSVGEQMAYFDFEVLPTTDIQKISVAASGAGESASYEVELDVENPNPISQQSKAYTLEANGDLSIDFDTFGTLGSNTASIELSTLPPMDLDKRLNYLIRYPYGCSEQVTSSVFPQLFLPDILDLTLQQKKDMEQNIKDGIQTLGSRQAPNGGLTYWPGSSYIDDWITSYAGHFMLEAKQKGYALPLTFLSNWTRYQKQAARDWNPRKYQYNTDDVQAYRLYTLALAGEPDLSAMNRLREVGTLANTAKWRLAATYALLGKDQVAKQLAATANIDFKPYQYDYLTYGSVFRNRAMALETMVVLGDDHQRELAESLAKNLSSQNWYSTQETAYALLALSKMVAKNGGKALKATIGSENIDTQKAIAQRNIPVKLGANNIKIKNLNGNLVYVTLLQQGRLPVGEELAAQRNLAISTTFLDGAGKNLEVSKLMQGTEITAKVTVTNTSGDWVNNVALTQIFPSGWEVVNTSFTEMGDPNAGKATYTDIRDDRVHYYFDLGSKKSKTFTLKLNASYMGHYYLPGAQVEAMYDNSYYARNKGAWVDVVQ